MGTKITDLPPVATPAGTDELPISQDSGPGGRITYKATIDQIKNYIKTTGGIGTGTVTDVVVNSTDGSIGVVGSPIITSGTISLTVNSVALGKLNDGGAINGQVLTYNGTSWVASAVPTELPSGTNGQVLTHNGTNWIADDVPTELPSGTNGQVLTHNGTNWIAGAVPSCNALLSSNGWQKFPSGLIMQWGELPTTEGERVSVPVIFPLVFPTAVVSFNITANTNNRPSNEVNVWSVYNYSLSGFTARTQDNDSTPYEGWWVAMGY
jgi:hypothetical protein